MNFAQPDAVSADAAPQGLTVLWWLARRLERLGAVLVGRMAAEVPAEDVTKADRIKAWLLLSRAVRWTHALQARLARGDVGGAKRDAAVRAETAPADAPDEAKAGDAKAGDAKAGDAKAGDAKVGANDRASGGKAATGRQRTADDEIRGKPTEVVVARICADMETAALLLGEADLAQRATSLAARAKALLSGETAPEADPTRDATPAPAPAPTPHATLALGPVALDPPAQGAGAIMPGRALAAPRVIPAAAPDTG